MDDKKIVIKKPLTPQERLQYILARWGEVLRRLA